MTFQEQLNTLRKQKGLSQEQLGEKLGVTRQTISKWELGITTPEMDKLIQLSDLFQISIDELVGRSTGSESSRQSPVREIRYVPWHYEYKSARTFCGLPLIHINLGSGRLFMTGGIRRAKGVIAIGNIATGIFAFGALSAGIISIGGASVGLLSIGGLALGLLLAFGGLSIGTVSFGGLAIGILSAGGCAVGIYALGGAAIGQKIAAGDYARAAIAIGNTTVGQICFSPGSNITSDAVRSAILQLFPGTWEIIIRLFTMAISAV